MLMLKIPLTVHLFLLLITNHQAFNFLSGLAAEEVDTRDL